ncbi:MAG: hypothetical protein MUE73_01165 [Planctomycetes bacterium]|jgi:hypothetical protein|nr:hypothetical protein [Planctomycetota bacterium]
MARAKKEKPAKKARDEAASRTEVDAVKAFIVVMVVLNIALGVFIFITAAKLSEVETKGLDRARRLCAGQNGLGFRALQIQEYLKLIADTAETTLLNSPERFFGNIYVRQDIRPEQVTLGPPKETKNIRDKYTEVYWDIEITGISRQQATLFAHGVEANSPKAKVIELSIRRVKKKDAPEDQWDARYKVGYRIAATR